MGKTKGQPREDRKKNTHTNDIDIGVGEDGAMSVGGLALVDGRVAKVDVLQDQRAAGCQSPPGVLVQLCRKKKTHRFNTDAGPTSEGRLILSAAPVHPPDRGIPFLDQLTAGEGVPSAWQSSLTVSPGAYSWLTGDVVQ